LEENNRWAGFGSQGEEKRGEDKEEEGEKKKGILRKRKGNRRMTTFFVG
jgi:hypothetical protein